MLEAIDHSPEKAKPGEAETETMAKKIEKTLCIDPPLARIHLASVRTEVNKLKHKLYGQEPRHALARPEPNDIDNAMAAINELVAIMERAEIKSHMSARFAEPPPA
jgi:hypothetical protein